MTPEKAPEYESPSLDFAGVRVPMTAANLMLWVLFEHPNRSYPVAAMLHRKRAAAINLLHRAADSLGKISPRLAVKLRHEIHWTGGTARYVPVVRDVTGL